MKNVIRVYISFLFALSFLLADTEMALADNKKVIDVCILNFEREAHAFTQMLNQIVQNNDRVLLISEALPIDFELCLKQNPIEIIWVGHALSIPGKKISWGYYTRLHDEERIDFLNSSAQYLENLIAKEQHYLNQNKNCDFETNLKENSHCYEYLQRKDLIKNNITYLNKLKSWPEDEPVYGFPRTVSPQIFRQARVATEKASRWRSFKVVSCEPKEVLANYPDLTGLLDQYKIQTELAPRQEISSWFTGTDRTVLDPQWIANSLQSANGKMTVYIQLQTVGLVRIGEATILHGQYRLRLKGFALGFESRWSTIELDPATFKDLKIGEKKSVPMTHLTASIALGVGIEVGLSPSVKFDSPTQINSIGASIGLFSEIEIERLY